MKMWKMAVMVAALLAVVGLVGMKLVAADADNAKPAAEAVKVDVAKPEAPKGDAPKTDARPERPNLGEKVKTAMSEIEAAKKAFAEGNKDAGNAALDKATEELKTVQASLSRMGSGRRAGPGGEKKVEGAEKKVEGAEKPAETK